MFNGGLEKILDSEDVNYTDKALTGAILGIVDQSETIKLFGSLGKIEIQKVTLKVSSSRRATQ